MQTAADPPRRSSENPEKQTVGTVPASHKVLSLEALSSSLNVGTANRGGREKAFGSSPAVRPPERPRPFTHYRDNITQLILEEGKRPPPPRQDSASGLY